MSNKTRRLLGFKYRNQNNAGVSGWGFRYEGKALSVTTRLFGFQIDFSLPRLSLGFIAAKNRSEGQLVYRSGFDIGRDWFTESYDLKFRPWKERIYTEAV